jgi:hypothetical protein
MSFSYQSSSYLRLNLKALDSNVINPLEYT